MRCTTCDKLVTTAPVTCAACRGIGMRGRGKPKPNFARSRCQGHPDDGAQAPVEEECGEFPFAGQPSAMDIIDGASIIGRCAYNRAP